MVGIGARSLTSQERASYFFITMLSGISKLDLKWISLVTLVIQTAAIVLVMRYSRALPGTPYLASTAVVMGETVKLLLSLLFYTWTEFKADRLSLRNLYMDIFGKSSDWKMMTVPAILYFFQNNLQYHAITIVCLNKNDQYYRWMQQLSMLLINSRF